MSIYYTAAISVGLPKEELSDFDNEDETLESFGGWDCGGEGDVILGFELLSAEVHTPREVPLLAENSIHELKKEFKKLTGLEAKLYLTCGVC